MRLSFFRGLARCLSGGALISLAAISAAAPVVPGFERFHRTTVDDTSLAEGGLLLLSELNCAACHSLPGGTRLPPRARLALAQVGDRLDAATLAAFVSHPASIKLGSLMPAVAQSPAHTQALVAYLSSLKAAPGSFPAIVGEIELGKRLYQTVGCVACHAPDESARPEAPTAVAAPSLSVPSVPIELAKYYERSALVDFLVDPLQVRPAGRMPSSHLSPKEASDIAAYLQRGGKPRVAGSTRVASTPALIAEGQHLFSSLGCVACHTTASPGDATPAAMGPALDGPDSSLTLGCLSPTPGRAPNFDLDDGQRLALRRAIVRLRSDPGFLQPEPRREVARFMAQLNCYACHSREGRGGVEPARAAYFEVTDSGAHSLGDMGNLPPALEHTGRKLTENWWRKLLWEGGGEVRPYQAARMPAFGQANCEPVLAAWVEADRRSEPVKIDVTGNRLHQRSGYGRTLMGTQDGGMGCVTCHGILDRKSLGMPVVPLDHTVKRLQPEYFKELLLNPQSVQPGTLMPPMFLGRPKADVEVEQLWTYLKEADQLLLPEGLLRTEEYELKPEAASRPIVFRTFLQGAGLQAVAVGSPTGRHVAFDAAEVRWALTWRGRFLDALTTWEERAMTPAKPLGEAVTALPTWMPLSRSPDVMPSGSEAGGAAAAYRYRGFSLGADGVPTFHYEVGPLRIDDTIRPDPRATGYLRVLVVRGGTGGWYFRGATAGALPRPVFFNAAGEATLEESLP